MTEQQQYLACAELDGLKGQHYYKCSDPWDGDCDICGGKAPSSKHEWPDYSTRDAVIGVIEKLWAHSGNSGFDGNKFSAELWKLINKAPCCNTCDTIRTLKTTPAQLREALLRATGKWTK